MDLVKPVLVALAVLVAGFFGAVAVGSVASRFVLDDLADILVVALPVMVAAFAAGGVAARVHAAPHRHRPARHLLAATLGPALLGAAGAAGVERGVDYEAVARLANLVVPLAAALAGARLLDRGGRHEPQPGKQA